MRVREWMSKRVLVLAAERGQTVAEYAIVIVIIVVGLATALVPVGGPSIASTIVDKLITAVGRF
jgi:hypothetical protein